MKKIILYIIGFVVLVGAFFLVSDYIYIQKQGDGGFQKDYKNISYMIEGREVTLVNGYSEIEIAPNSASKIITKYFGNEAEGDISGDGVSDISFLITQESGGSGVFYYLVSAIKTDLGYKGTNAILLGDRIAPQTTNYNNGEITVNYADRKPGEPMTASPSVGVSRYFKVENGLLVEQMDLADFGKEVTFAVNQKVKFTDGLILTLKQIDDSRCKPNVVCIWAGELAPTFDIKGGNYGSGILEVIEISLGTIHNSILVESGYIFELKSATETTATIVINRKEVGVDGCYIGGCSSQICSDQEDVVSTCEYREEYACYKNAKCERQNDGKCGWTQTDQLTQCLNSAK
ncbi:MAG: hypothetical protein A3D35_02755 [Candidatus Staskawiczbacteria bacterium RIFCSPHIGHO2_02_FULL_34_9]|uniref:Uncharacterized protein n=1 Tax=Candidatus Staskawiczbacteria bacterium RIFCSPHIGHO2_02_FULL_34_9 TaxID=1802206 RepID=A0A1G2I3Q2_9BACT|nr:MAG: hypothetical protein A3D35_02755 [Candidatus Staskawiczbacteria bacterium RIFCSPHIGHO2_02_FULL_34_9]